MPSDSWFYSLLFFRNSPLAQRVTDLLLSLQWFGSLLWHGFDSQPRELLRAADALKKKKSIPFYFLNAGCSHQIDFTIHWSFTSHGMETTLDYLSDYLSDTFVMSYPFLMSLIKNNCHIILTYPSPSVLASSQFNVLNTGSVFFRALIWVCT